MKTKEELNALREEVEALNKKLADLNDEELAQIVGGSGFADLNALMYTKLKSKVDPGFSASRPVVIP